MAEMASTLAPDSESTSPSISEALPGSSGTAAGCSPGRQAGGDGQSGGPLSPGRELMDVCPSSAAGIPVFQPPRGYSALEMADFLRDRLGLRPSSIVRMLGACLLYT